MKTYELMEALSKLPAGADVIVTGEITEAALRKGIVVKEDKEGQKTYATRAKVVCAVSDGNCIVIDSVPFVGADD